MNYERVAALSFLCHNNRSNQSVKMFFHYQATKKIMERLFGVSVQDVKEAAKAAVGVSTTSASDSVTEQGSLSYLRQLMDWDTIAVETDIIAPFGRDLDKTHKAIKMAEAGATTGEIIVVIEEDIDVDVYLTKRVQNLAKALEEMKKIDEMKNEAYENLYKAYKDK